MFKPAVLQSPVCRIWPDLIFILLKAQHSAQSIFDDASRRSRKIHSPSGLRLATLKGAKWAEAM